MNRFEITIQRKSKESWPIVVERSQPGVLLPIRHESTFQLSQIDIEELYSLLGQPEDYGTFLGEKLFQGDVRVAFDRASGESPDGLRILLFVEAEDIDLRTLRWERLCAPKDGHWDFLRLAQDLPFSIYIPASTDRRFPPIGKRDLRALVLAASPTNLGKYRLDAFDVEGSVAGVRKALGEIPSDVLALISGAIGPPTLDELCRQLTDRSKQYTLLHFISHGKVLKDGDTALYWASAGNQAEVVTGQKLIQRLRRLQGPRGLPHFAFLSTCESASPEAEGAMGGLGQRLVRDLGMPAVIAMTEKVTVTTALALGQCFYQQLHESGHIDSALAEATAGLAGRHDITVPALFSRLAGQPLFSDSLDRPLTNAEIKYGLEQLQILVTERAPVLQEELAQQTQMLQSVLKADATALSKSVRLERDQTLFEINTLCQEVSDLCFNALALGQTPPDYEAHCPFLGLYPFHAEDREFFFGRETLTGTLQQKLAEHPFLAVLGPSGSGKSSVILAGLVPQLQAQQPDLKLAYLTPSHEPLGQLTTAQALVANQPAVFVVDQFEELFTLCTDDEERQQFIEQLLNLNQQQRVVITMRADFWGECAPYKALKTQMEARQTLIGPMNTAELRSAMEQQAAKVGLRFEADLSNAILDDVKEEPGAMPLLQHGLQELWKRRHGRWLNTVEYREGIGGIRQAIAKTADDVYNQLFPAEQTQFKNIFIRLTRLDENTVQGEGGRDTRRRVGIEELVPANGELAATKKLVKHLADARLVVTSVNTVTHREEVEVAHEALIRYWPRLANWLDENRTNLHLRETIRQAALTWTENQNKEDYLVHKGVRLEDARALAHADFLNQLEAGYVNTCVALQNREQAEKEKQQRQKLKAEQEARRQAERRVKQFRWGTAVLSVFLLVTVGAGVLAWNQKQEAVKKEQQALKTQSRFLADLAQQETAKGNATNGVLLALAALPKNSEKPEKPYVPEARAQLYNATVNLHEQHVFKKHTDSVGDVEFSPDGTLIVTASNDNTARLWDVKTSKQLHVLKGHKGDVYRVAFSPDSKQVVTASEDKTARLWNTTTGKPITIFEGHKNSVYHVAFNPKEKSVVTASFDNTARVWNTETGEEIVKLKHDDNVMYATFSPDGQYIVTASIDKTARLWDAHTGEALKIWKHGGKIYSANFSPDGKKVVTASFEKVARLWEVESDQPLFELNGHIRNIHYAEFSSDGKHIVTAALEPTAQLWDAKTGQSLFQLKGHKGVITNISFSSDNQFIVTVSQDSDARLWEVKTGQLLARLGGHEADIFDAAFSPDGQQVVTASFDGTARLWNIKPNDIHYRLEHQDMVWRAIFSPDGQQVATISGNDASVWNTKAKQQQFQLLGHTNKIQAVAFSVDGKKIVTASRDHTARLWEVHTGKQIAELKHKNSIWHASFSPDGQYVGTASEDKTARLWDANTGEFKRELVGHQEKVGYIVFSPKGKYVATTSKDKTARLWEVNTGNLLHVFEGHTDEIEQAAFSPKAGNYLVTASKDKTARLWKIATGQEFHELKGHTGFVMHATFSPDGLYVVTASNDKTARLWRVENGQQLKQLNGHTHSVRHATFSNSGKHIVTTSSDRTARLWNVNGKLLALFAGHHNWVNYAAFSPDDQYIVTASEDKTARLWKLFSSDKALVEHAHNIVPRQLTLKQRQQFFIE